MTNWAKMFTGLLFVCIHWEETVRKLVLDNYQKYTLPLIIVMIIIMIMIMIMHSSYMARYCYFFYKVHVCRAMFKRPIYLHCTLSLTTIPESTGAYPSLNDTFTGLIYVLCTTSHPKGRSNNGQVSCLRTHVSRPWHEPIHVPCWSETQEPGIQCARPLGHNMPNAWDEMHCVHHPWPITS